MPPRRPTYTFDVDGHTVVTPTPNNERETYQTLNRLFGLFKGIAFGECIAIAATLFAQLYITMPSSSIGLMTQFYYWAIRMFGADTMIYTWIIIGMVIVWVHDFYTNDGVA